MATPKQKAAARKNIKKAQAAKRKKKAARKRAGKKAAATRKRKARKPAKRRKPIKRRKARRNPVKRRKAPKRRKPVKRRKATKRRKAPKKRRKAKRNPSPARGMKKVMPYKLKDLKPKKSDPGGPAVVGGTIGFVATSFVGGITEKLAKKRKATRQMHLPISLAVQAVTAVGMSYGARKCMKGSKSSYYGRYIMLGSIVAIGLRLLFIAIRGARGMMGVDGLAAWNPWADLKRWFATTFRMPDSMPSISGNMSGSMSDAVAMYGEMGMGSISQIGEPSGDVGEVIGNVLVGMGMADWMDEDAWHGLSALQDWMGQEEWNDPQVPAINETDSRIGGIQEYSA